MLFYIQKIYALILHHYQKKKTLKTTQKNEDSPKIRESALTTEKTGYLAPQPTTTTDLPPGNPTYP